MEKEYPLARLIGLMFKTEQWKMVVSYLDGRDFIEKQIRENGILTAKDIVIACTTHGFPKSLIY